MPKVYIIPEPSPNAFATGRNPHHAAVAATEGLLRILDERELAGVIAHELAHVKHRDILISSVAATLAAAIMMAARFAMFFGGGRSDEREGQNPMALLAMMILAPIAAMLIQAAISRSREFAADAGARAASSASPHGLVGALRKLEASSKRRAARRQPGDGAHVHHQAVRGWRVVRRCSAPIRRRERRIQALMNLAHLLSSRGRVPAGLPPARDGGPLPLSHRVLAYVLLPSFLKAEATVHVEDLDISPSKIAETAQRIIDRAIEEARRREHALLTNEHMFLAFAQVEWDTFAEVMRDIELNPHTHPAGDRRAPPPGARRSPAASCASRLRPSSSSSWRSIMPAGRAGRASKRSTCSGRVRGDAGCPGVHPAAPRRRAGGAHLAAEQRGCATWSCARSG